MKVKIELNSQGIREFLKSESVRGMLGEKAQEIAKRCGDGYGSDTYDTPGRVVASVFTDSDEAKRDNSDNNTILKNLK